MSISQGSQVYDKVLSEYREMMQSIRRNEDISANLACELQKELLRMSEISCQDDGLKDVYKNIQAKEEIMKTVTENLGSIDMPNMSDRQTLKETIKYASNILQEISTAFQEFNSVEDKITE